MVQIAIPLPGSRLNLRSQSFFEESSAGFLASAHRGWVGARARIRHQGICLEVLPFEAYFLFSNTLKIRVSPWKWDYFLGAESSLNV